MPDSKTGAKIVHFGKTATDVLKGIAKLDDNPYVITGQKPGSRLTDLQHPWRRIRAKANLPDVRIHDLRHSYASGALALGEGLPMIGKLLGHTQVQTTARYAHLASDPVKLAAGRICNYCNGFCEVFRAAEHRQTFNDGDLTYLAHLCRGCRNCWPACQYAPPHPFAINVPRVFWPRCGSDPGATARSWPWP